MAEMTQFRSDVNASEKINLSAMADISGVLGAALNKERETAEQEKIKFTNEIVTLINALVDGQQGRWSNAVEQTQKDLSTSQNKVQSGYQLVSKGLDQWAERETTFSKEILGNKEEVKKSIVDAAKVPRLLFQRLTVNRLRSNVVRRFKRALDESMPKRSNLWILR
jgi:hypothetical protein